ncbi:MAG: HAD family hydrolase [Steroidobacteraceae bacterium]
MARRPVRLVAFDLDGTLLRGATVCEVLAARFGMQDRMREFEQLRDIAAISAARQEMLQWYGDMPLERLCAGLTRAEIAPGAVQAFRLLAARGVHTAIVSVTWAFAVEWFARRFGAEAWVGTTVMPAGSIGHFWPSDKPVWLSRHSAALGVGLAEVAAVGDSHGDIPMLARVGHPVFVGAQLPPELAHAEHRPMADMREIAEAILAG